jgi:hypothetical protein
MSLLPRRSQRLSLAVAVAAYASGTILVGLITAHALQRVGVAVLGQLGPVADAPRPQRPQAADTQPSVRSFAAMTPLHDRSTGPMRSGATRLAAGPEFGTSSRTSRYGGRPWDRGDDDDEDRPAGGGTYRTVCVRLCDGYYFPLSFAVTPDRLERDSQVCASRCGTNARLFVHANPGGSVEDMEDRQGRPYRQLRTAFLYRTEYVPSCKCQPHPWEAASVDRHRTYALSVAVKKGNREAAKELQALQAKVRQAAKSPDRSPAVITPPAPTEVPRSSPASAEAQARQEEIAARDGGSLMRLGGDGAPKARAEPREERTPQTPRSDRSPDWIKRIFGAGTGG